MHFIVWLNVWVGSVVCTFEASSLRQQVRVAAAFTGPVLDATGEATEEIQFKFEL